MAPRRGRNTKTINNPNYSNLSIDDVLCPICRSVLTQPVTLPCNHGFCFACFEGTMQNANLACPLCRVRIGSWYRIAKKEKRLVNQRLWEILREKFPKQLENKLKGIDEQTVEEVKIPIATPGEIRREYELQKRKEDEELKQEREKEQIASEALIEKLKREEKEYLEAVKEEELKKIKLDAQVAKKLSQEFQKTPVRKTTLDHFFNNKDSNKKMTPKMQNFATKEYTCRVLCLDVNSSQPSTSKGYCGMPVYQKKIQQLQKIVVNVDSSDGSDCIEQECRYFKPIDYRHNPPSAGKAPIKVPTRRATLCDPSKILRPSGDINFQSNILESAFARISIDVLPPQNYKSTEPTQNKNKAIIEETPGKRKAANNAKTSPSKRKKSDASPAKPKRQIFQENTSPKFFGFDNSAIKNSLRNRNLDSAKKIQEKADFEFARKLQQELNRTSQYSTRSQISSTRTRRSKRQITLDEIVSNAYKVV
ncbi:unnamed protein product [Brassicogethes aeneus]|uniref:RING-type E3 ubiquitin transferase n=1 Tax=Brassicogethes aeneus TaxID=1431903 RepID=A0A9P0B9A0_BRAAE|nr:unnamed protein product [Brassicogethes aeneus]